MNKAEQYAKGQNQITINEKALSQNWNHIRWNHLESIMEVGIGGGRVTKHVILPKISANLKEYIGSDISERMLEYCNTIIDHPKFSTLALDICAKTLPEQLHNRFDKVFACFLLHMVSANIK